MSTGDGARRVCVLTGAGGTLGNAFCRAYADQYDIVAVCRNRRPDAVSQFESYVDPLDPGAELAANRASVYVVYADLEKATDIERIVDVTLARHGRIDVLVNNAAYAGIHPRGLTDGDSSLLDFDRHFRLNVGVPLELAVRFAQAFWRTRDLENRQYNRNIVNVSSLSGSQVFPFVGQGVYAASKAALNQLTRHLAAEFGTFGVRVNGLAPNNFPGIVSTEQVARAVAQLDQVGDTGRIRTVDVPAPRTEAATLASAAGTD